MQVIHAILSDGKEFHDHVKALPIISHAYFPYQHPTIIVEVLQDNELDEEYKRCFVCNDIIQTKLIRNHSSLHIYKCQPAVGEEGLVDERCGFCARILSN